MITVAVITICVLTIRAAIGHLTLAIFRAHPELHQKIIDRLEAAAAGERLRYRAKHGEQPK